MILIDIIVFVIVFLLGLAVVDRFDVSPRNRRILQWLWVYHLLFGVLYWAYITYGRGGDAIRYWEAARYITLPEFKTYILSEPTYFVIALCAPLAGMLKLSFFSTSLIFSLVGFIGIALAYVTYERSVPYNARIGRLTLFPLLFFLPNLHFWSAGVGKDTIIFLCIALFFFCLTKPKKYIFWLIFSLALSYFVRPHITLFLIVAAGVGFVLDGRLKAYHKALLLTALLICGIWLFGRVEAFLKIDDINTENITNLTQARASNLSRASVGSAVDISSYPWPLKLFTFLFRPLFFDAHNMLAFVTSFENLLLLIISIRVLASKPVTAFKEADFLIKTAIVFAIIGAVGCSMIMSNLGIILRQKNMFIPALYLFIGWTLARRNNPAGRQHRIKQ